MLRLPNSLVVARKRRIILMRNYLKSYLPRMSLSQHYKPLLWFIVVLSTTLITVVFFVLSRGGHSSTVSLLPAADEHKNVLLNHGAIIRSNSESRSNKNLNSNSKTDVVKDAISISSSPLVCVDKGADIDQPLSIDTLHLASTSWNVKLSGCRRSLEAFQRIYTVTRSHGEITIDSDVFKNKVRDWLGHNEYLYKSAYSQNITAIYNRYTREETVYNPLRAKRPVPKATVSDLDYIEDLQAKTRNECDFCRYANYTAHDLSGRLEAALAVSAANTFRYDKLHQLILSKSHHPLNWSKIEFTAMFALAHQWFKNSHREYPAYTYPVISWDLLPHAGASQVHPHLQLLLRAHYYPGVVESWRAAALDYYQDSGTNYFNDFVAVHDALGLTVRLKDAVAVATLTAKKDNEVVIICRDSLPEFYSLLYYVIRTFIDDKKTYPFSMTAALPPMHDNKQNLPAFVRIVTRGHASEIRSDISSLELFTFSNVVSDPFKLVKEIKRSVLYRH